MPSIDIRQGGLGDVWMRLCSFYSFSTFTPQASILLSVPKSIQRLATALFSDRLVIEDRKSCHDYVYTSLGARSLLTQVAGGQRFITPYSSFVSAESTRAFGVNKMNQAVIRVLDRAGCVRSPRLNDIHFYQGFSDLAPLARDAKVCYDSYLARARADFFEIRGRLQRLCESAAGNDAQYEILVFPSGTSRQCMPAAWAHEHLPTATYAFFQHDPLKSEFDLAGLRCVTFAKDPLEMVSLMAGASWCVSTDSFASHLMQSFSDRATALLTELASVRIISPFFGGNIVPSMAPCYPCRKTARAPGSTCQAGRAECVNWLDPKYAEASLSAIGGLPKTQIQGDGG